MDTLGVDSILVGGDRRLRADARRDAGAAPRAGRRLRARERRPGARSRDGIRVVNAGSVGAPYEAEPGAYWLLAADDLELRRTEYDVEAAVARIAANGYPRRSIFEHELGVRDPERPARIAAIIEGGS